MGNDAQLAVDDIKFLKELFRASCPGMLSQWLTRA